MEFIRVKVEHRYTFVLVEVTQRAEEETARQEAEVAATGDREARPANLPGSQGIFTDRAAWGRDRKGAARRFRDAVTNAREGKHARVVSETQLDQDLETPMP